MTNEERRGGGSKNNDEQATVTSEARLPTQLDATLRIHKGAVHVARLNAQGRYLLTAGADRQIHLFNAITLAAGGGGSAESTTAASSTPPIKTYSAHNGAILALSIASDNATFVSAGEDRNVLQWDVASGTVVRRFSAHAGTVQAVLHCGAPDSPNDVVAAAGFDGALRMYDMRARGAWKPIMTCAEAKDSILSVAWHAGSACVWTGSVDGVLRAYDVRAGQLREDTIDRPITSITPSATGTSLLVTALGSDGSGDSNDGNAKSKNATHIILDVADGAHLQTVQGGENVHYRCRSSLWAADGTIVAGDERGGIAAWDVLSGKRFTSTDVQQTWQQAHAKAVLWTEMCAPKSGGESRAVTASADGTVKLWSVPPLSR